MSLSELSTFLRSTIPSKGVRPFVCDGDPTGCQVAVIGHNPRNADVEFWPYWDDALGFNKSTFDQDYLRSKGRFKGTRLRLRRLSDSLGDVKSLETNIYWVPSKWFGSRDLLDLEPITKLLNMVSPQVVVAHGAKTIGLIDDVVLRAGLKTCHTIKVGHFMRLGYDAIDKISDDALQFIRSA